jgi:Ca2+-binding EF-hand superfamily protein
MEKEPSDAELQQFMDLVDSDKSGTVSFQEFLTAITKWISEDREPTKEDRKRKFVESV